jgi:hypothetical protein
MVAVQTENYITGSVNIGNGLMVKDGVTLFANHDADVPAFLLSAYQHFKFSYPKFYKMDNLSKLGWLAAELLLQDNFNKDDYRPEEVGIILANANASLDDDIKYWKSAEDEPSPSLFVYTLPNIVIGEISIRHRFKGEHAFYIQDKFDGAFITQQVNYLLDKNIIQACICGWVEVLGDSYKAVLYLVEKKTEGTSALFSEQNVEGIFNNSLQTI